MDVALTLRSYQQACVAQAVKANTIVSLPTGTGKTLVAITVIDHFRGHGVGRTMFVVPTRVLVGQQAGYCRTHCCGRPRVAELSGNEMEGWTKQMWQNCLRDHEVLVGTPEVFRRAFVDMGYIKVTDFALMVFDECHNATGNSPMASIMRDAVWPLARSRDCPRILGLTASFVNGSLKNLDKKRQDLETLMLSELFCPRVTLESRSPERSRELAGPHFENISYPCDSIANNMPLVEQKLDQLFQKFEIFGVPIKDTKKVKTRTCHVLGELGMSSFLFYLREGIIPQLESHAQELSQLAATPQAQNQGSRLNTALPQLRQQLREAADVLSKDGTLTRVPLISSKASVLLDLVGRLFATHANADRSYRGIIFVTQISLTFPLAHILNSHFQDNPKIVAGCVSGTGSMIEALRSNEMERFRQGVTTVLVCTNALEEGVDVSDCAFVIRFNKFDTTKSHIQGSGRARRADAKVYYFDNNTDAEQANARYMTDVARDASLALTNQEILQRKDEATRVVPGVYPFRLPGSDAEVNFFNCLQIVYEFVAMTMRQSYDPEDLYIYQSEVVCLYPRQVRKFVKEVQYPSPDGMQIVALQEVNDHWSGVRLDDVLDPIRIRNMDASDLERRRILYVVAIDMHEKGYLDSNNRPSARATNNTKLVCPAYTMSSRINIKNTFDKNALARDFSNGGEDNLGDPGGYNGTQRTPASTLHQLLTNEHQPPEVEQTNFKGILNEWIAAQHRRPTTELLQYNSHSCGGAFKAAVTLHFLGHTYSGDVRSTKKLAEQHAAKVACEQLGLIR